MLGVFVTGTDTEVGKTFQSCLLARELTSRGKQVGVYKPAASGVSADSASDPQLLAEAAGIKERVGEGYEARVCPQQFEMPLAPPVAAELENSTLDEELLIEGATWWQDHCEFLIVEGVGGFLCPLGTETSVADIAVKLNLPVIIVAANRLGVVNHTLLTVEAVQQRSLPIVGIVLNDMLPESSSDVSRRTNSQLLKQWLPNIPIVENITELAGSL